MGESDVSGSETVGDVIDGRYRLTDLLGRGGMGSVYRAEHVSIKRPVALKVLNPELRRHSELNDRLEREAFATGRLAHPHCVEISDSGRLADGSFYLVMELLDGCPLSDELEDRERLELRRSLRIVRQVLGALGHAHGQGVVHRDLKPENVFLTRKGDDIDYVKLLDFGITKLVGDALVEAGGKQLTQTGLTVGTPTYMAPEQVSGGTIDGRTDLYSVSVLLFEMLTGRPPFTGDGQMELVTQKLTKTAPTLTEVAPELSAPRSVEEMLRDGLSRDPADRISTAEEYITRIEGCLVDLRQRAGSQPVAFAGTEAAMTTPPPVAGETRRLVTPMPQAPPTPMPQAPQQTPAPHAPPTPMPHAPQQTPAPHAPQQTPAPHAPQQTPAPHAPPTPMPQAPPTPMPQAPQQTPAPVAPHTPVPGSGPRFPRFRWTRTHTVVAIAFAALVMLILAVTAPSQEEQLRDLIHQLKHGESCEERRDAVLALRDLGDPRAIPALRHARRRMRGGVLGVGGENTNRCLRDDARKVVEHLKRLQ